MRTRNDILEFHLRDHAQRSVDGNFSSKIRASAGEFQELRPYIFGENASRIDFRKSNFDSDTLVLREYTQEKEFHVHIAIVPDASWRFGTSRYTKRDILIESLMHIVNSLWIQEIPGYIWWYDSLSQKTYSFPFPRQMRELESLCDFIRNWDIPEYHSDIPYQSSPIACISQTSGEGGILYFWESSFDWSSIAHRFQMLQIQLRHIEEIQLAQERDILACESVDFWARVTLLEPQTVHPILQEGLHHW